MKHYSFKNRTNPTHPTARRLGIAALGLQGVLAGLAVLLTNTVAVAQEELALNATPENAQVYGLVSPNPGLELKMSGPLDLVTLDFTGDSDDVWVDIRKSFSIPDLDSKAVASNERALKKNRRLVTSMLERSEPYIYFIAQECEKRGMPSELALLPFVESEFNPLAKSHAAAVGLWQFMPGTGKQFELKQNKWVDERRDLLASTRAALDYLTYLYDMHGDWHLALISYNWGEGSVLKAMKKAEDAGLEPVLANLDLPQETRQYIPKLQALKNLIQSPNRFGMTLPKFPNQPYFAEIKRKSDVDLREIAKLAGVDLNSIRKLNPGLNQPVLYAAHSNTLLVPVKYSEKIQASLKAYKPAKGLRTYTVAKGDTLGGIAGKFDVKTREIQQLNGLNKKTLIKPGMKLTIPNTPQPGSWTS